MLQFQDFLFLLFPESQFTSTLLSSGIEGEKGMGKGL
jgi:hypothetical protein